MTEATEDRDTRAVQALDAFAAADWAELARSVLVPAASILIVAAAVLLRFSFLADREMFRDEASSWLAASLSLPELIARVSGEPYPPLYPLLLKGWMAILGDGPAALRAFSGVCGLATLFVAWRWASESLGRYAGLVVAALVCFGPLAIAEARMARMYALETAFATAGWWLVWRLTTARYAASRRLPVTVALALCVAGEAWTMAFGVAVAGLQLVVATFFAWRRRRPAALVAVVAGGATFLPWLYVVATSPAASNSFWTDVPVLGVLGDTLSGWAGWGRNVSRDFTMYWVVAVAMLGIVGLTWRSSRALASALVAGIALCPIVWLVSQIHPVFDQRYFGPIMAPLLLGFTAATVPARLRPVLATFVVQVGRVGLALTIVAATAVAGIHSISVWRSSEGNAPAQAAMETVAAHMKPGDVVLAADTRSYFLVAYFAERTTSPMRLPGPVLDWHRPDEPFYYGTSLVGEEARIEAGTAARAGLRASIPGLAPGGHIWLVALANNGNLVGFAPLQDGSAQTIATYATSRGPILAQVLELEPLT